MGHRARRFVPRECRPCWGLGTIEVILPSVPLRCTHPSKRKNGVRWGPRHDGLETVTLSPHAARRTSERRKRGRGLGKLSQMRYLPTVVLTARCPTKSLLPGGTSSTGRFGASHQKSKSPPSQNRVGCAALGDIFSLRCWYGSGRPVIAVVPKGVESVSSFDSKVKIPTQPKSGWMRRPWRYFLTEMLVRVGPPRDRRGTEGGRVSFEF